MMHPSSASWVPPTAARNSRTMLDILLTLEILQVELKELSYILVWIYTKHKSNSLCQKNRIALTCCNWKTFVQGLIVSQCKWNTFQSWYQTPICAYLARRISIRFVIRIATFPLAAYLAGPICGTVAVAQFRSHKIWYNNSIPFSWFGPLGQQLHKHTSSVANCIWICKLLNKCC